MKNSKDANGNRTRDLPTCSAVPQPTALPRAPLVLYDDLKSGTRFKLQGCNREPQGVWHSEENCDDSRLASRFELHPFRE